MAQGIEVGDAVLNFIANTTDLDAAYAKVDQTPQRLQGATNAIKGMGKEIEVTSTGAREMGKVMDLAGKETEFSMYEAKGEIGLLGEAIGVHLPRHVRSFVAELPGVGAAMTAAFSATAAIFVIQAIIEMTEKVSDFIAESVIYTEAMKESDKAVIEANKTLIGYSAELKKLKAEYELIGLDAIGKYNVALKANTANLEEQRKKLIEVTEEQEKFKRGQDGFVEKFVSEQAWYSKAMDAVKSYYGVETSLTTAQLKRQQELDQERIESAKAVEVAEQKVKNTHKEISIASAEEDEKAYERGKRIQESINRMIESIRRENLEFEKLGRASNQVFEAQVDAIPMIVKDIETWSNALRQLGVVSIGQLTSQIHSEQSAVAGLEVLLATKHIGTLHDVHAAKLKLIQDEIKLAQAQGKSTVELEKQEKQIKKMLPEFNQFGKVGKEVADQVGHAITQTAFAYGQGAITITQALRQVTSSVISEIAKQAEVKGAAALAEAFNAFGHYDFTAGSHFLAASAAWFALGGGISAAAGAVAGGSATPGTAANPINVTGTAGASGGSAQAPKPVGGVNAQAFATGGLITKPTLALLGESPSSKGEVAFDLGDERAKQQIREAMGGGGEGDIHVHVKGLISGDNLGKVIHKINQRVKKGQSSLTASNSHRITRRSV